MSPERDLTVESLQSQWKDLSSKVSSRKVRFTRTSSWILPTNKGIVR